MFKIDHVQDENSNLDQVELKSTDNKSQAKIAIRLGGSLQELLLDNQMIIKNLYPLSYDVSYASAILFPFTNRVENGEYTFGQNQYSLEVNSKEENNALHGLVYNKTFRLVDEETCDDYASITLSYDEVEKVKGFPFYYTLYLTYILRQSTLELKVIVKNKDEKAFPFNIGWHPYFWSTDLYHSFLSVDSNKKISFDEKMIPVKVDDINLNGEIQVRGKSFDDCYVLNNNEVDFRTPDYCVNIRSSSHENYLQIYTPEGIDAIAIEPVTGPSNSFNNKFGLQVLNAGEEYNVTWVIKIKDDE